MAKDKIIDKAVDKKEQVKAKSTTNAKKSSYSKKKKIKKNILNGIAYVQSTFNNTIITIADLPMEMLFLGHLLDKKVLKDLENQLLMLRKLLLIQRHQKL